MLYNLCKVAGSMLEVGDLTSLAVSPSAVSQWMRHMGSTDSATMTTTTTAGGSGRARSCSLSTYTGGMGLWCY